LEAVGFFVFLAIVGGLVWFARSAFSRKAGGGFFGRGADSSWLAALSKLATRTKGAAYLHSPGYPQQVRFRARGTEVAVLLLPHNEGYVLATWFTLKGRRSRPICSASSAGWSSSAINAALPYALPAELGSVTGPSGLLFNLHGNSQTESIRWLDQNVLERLEQIERAVPRSNAAIFLRNTDACVALNMPFFLQALDDARMTVVLNAALQIHDLLEASDDAGISFMEPMELKVNTSEQCRCQVCGEDIVDETPVRCSVCKTPHHLECWQYNDQCGTYGCLSKNFEAGAHVPRR
jgi:hypothetical protein